MGKEKLIGIYSITNKINGKVYVGQSVNVYKRWKDHKYELNKNIHHNIYLQRAWNKYGKGNFEFEIIEICKQEELNDKEMFWIKGYIENKKSYNLTLGGDGTKGHPLSEEAKIKIGRASKGRKKTKEEIAIISKIHRDRSEEILQINLDGTILKEWNGLYQIREELNIDTRSISGCCKKEPKRYTYKNYIWLYKTDYEVNGLDLQYHLKHKTIKEVIQYDLDMNFIREWGSIKEASEELKIKDSQISRCCKNKIKSSGGYIWEYKY